MRTYEYGLFAADFAVEALRNRVSAALIWCLAPVYYSDQIQQKASLWEHKDRRWEPCPPFYSWSLLCRYTRPGSQVLATKTEPPAADLRSVALRAPSGEITLLIVNRCLRDLALEVQLPTRSKSKIREFLYSRNTVPTRDRTMLRPRALHEVTPGKMIPLSIPQDAFLMLTEIGG